MKLLELPPHLRQKEAAPPGGFVDRWLPSQAVLQTKIRRPVPPPLVEDPPKELIKETIPLEGIKAARPRVGPPPRAAIIEDDQRRRIVILSTEETGIITAYVLEDLDLKPHLSEVAFCAEEHHCEEDRMAITGGLGCIAICVKEVLDKLI